MSHCLFAICDAQFLRGVSMPNTVTRIHITSIPGLVGYVILWIILCECARMLATALRNDPLIGWAVGPLGISTLFVSEPSIVFILFNALFPAAISACVLYFGLFTALPSPIFLPHHLFVETLVICGGGLFLCIGDFLDVVRDLRDPLCGVACVLFIIHIFQAT